MYSFHKYGLQCFLFYLYINIYLERRIALTTNNESKKEITVNSTVQLKGIVKAIFNDSIHVQIGGKIITLPASNLLKQNNPLT